MKRTAFLTAATVAAAASTALARAQTGVPGGTHFVERSADFDAAAFGKLLGRPAKIRQVVEQVAFKPGILSNVKNSLNGLQFGFGYAPDEIAIAMANHGPSAAYGYSDYIWSKYRIGEFFGIKNDAGEPLTSNVYLAKRASLETGADPDDDKGMYQDTSIEMLQARGVVMLTCHTAVEEQAKALVKKNFAPAGATAKDVAADLLTHLIPGSVVVPSMVATIAVLQETYRYTYLSPAF